MNACFAIPEIVTMICDAALADVDRFGHPVNRGDVVRLARTCKFISLAALRSLWRAPPNLPTMLGWTMPERLWNEAEELTPTRPIQIGDLTRFRFYASFVRDIGIGQGATATSIAMSAEAYIALCLAFGHDSTPIFPNLTTLNWDMDGISPLSARYFISPSLVRLHIKVDEPTMGDVTVLQQVQQQCPAITDLNLDIQSVTVDNKQVVAISDTICAWNLETLRTTYLSWRALGRMAASTTLKKLHLTLVGKTDFNAVSISKGAFSSLGYLCIEQVPISFGTCISMLRQSNFTCLHTLTITSLSPDPPIWEKLLPALRSAHKQPHMLRRLTLKETRTRTATSGRHEATPGTCLESLCKFSQLEELSISCGKEFLINARTIQRMAAAWPELRALSFSIRYRFTPTLPLSALSHLASRCPHLKLLRIDVSASGVSLKDAPPPPFTPQSALTSLAVDWSTITSTRVVAAYLSTLFSDVNAITSKSETGVDLSQGDVRRRKWQKVLYLLPAFTVMREHVERRTGGALYEGIKDSRRQRKELDDEEYGSDSD
ncbi:hypothetical protein BD626DRAFT_625848 [Schizophyllum amplum]|uniref:F-box domain-containing protein n=1 Tax=Schizophyllum amplum TaxID=97359 RepID=A0A550CRG0_9AGAR|nr:hypothetical protein BD626DRAFT_625848 [Auriculariopsis ampla]